MLVVSALVSLFLLTCVDVGATNGVPKLLRPVRSQWPAFNVYEQPLRVNVSSDMRCRARDLVLQPRSRHWLPLSEQIAAATAYLAAHHGIPAESIAITDAYTDSASKISHIYARQTINGLPVINGLANVNINSNGHVISSSQSFAPSTTSVDKPGGSSGSSLDSALASLVAYVGSGPSIAADALSSGQCTASKALIRAAEGIVAPVWHIALKHADHWWSACVHTEHGRVESLNDWVYSAESFRVFPRTVLSLADGVPQMVVGPANITASPKGWVAANTTAGNNVWAQSSSPGGGNDTDGWRGNYRPNAAPGKVFDYPLDLTQQPATYRDFAITQLFYTVNAMHDLAFIYGFDEAAGNFQDTNYSGLGRGNDSVIATAQDGGGTNNAMFEAPPDGQHGRMRMFVWNATTPNRDGGLEQDIVVHEFTHGISARLTGGPSNADCLGDGEPAGMGEGWSDTVAWLLRIRPGHTRSIDMAMGEYVRGSADGIRKHPYSTSLQTNPATYGYLDRPEYQEAHAAGEVWAAILYEVTWNLADANGIADDLLAHDLVKGTALMLQILLDAMKLQPCNPSFIDARSAIVQAERNLTGGKNQCALWRAFAKRGLGTGAKFDKRKRTEDFGVPDICSS
ncbi:hypothetical protein GGF44_001354 [Coemansia sp. RSA 1694]|nr:hypothetical protein GGF44_001354 [Coemansia sp. RSA 1694]